MSRKKKLKKALLAGAALYGASKLAGLGAGKGISGKTTVSDAQKMTQLPAKKVEYITKKKTAVGPQKVKYPRLKVDSTGNVFKDGVNTGVGNKKTLFVNRDPKLGTGTGIYQGGTKVKDLNPKAITRLTDGKITTGGKVYENKKAYRKAMDLKRATERKNAGSGFKNFMNKFVLGEKTQMKMGKMVKARGGGMARTKPTKMY